MALSASQVWDRRLANFKDSCTLSDRISVATLTTVGSSSQFGPLYIRPLILSSGVLAPGSLGSRVGDVALCYLRYRINRLLLCYRPIVGTATPGVFATGFADDPAILGAITPGNTNAVEELRCSHANSVYREIEVPWEPVDRKVWFYCDPTSTSPTSAELRQDCPCVLLSAIDFGPSTTTIGSLYVYYSITFEGAVSPVLTG